MWISKEMKTQNDKSVRHWRVHRKHTQVKISVHNLLTMGVTIYEMIKGMGWELIIIHHCISGV
jgi:hypothetical protein